jgi:hypothetical protein
MENEEQSVREAVDTTIVDVRDEASSQATSVFEFGHRVILAGIGALSMGIDQVQSLFESAVERGERAEADMHQRVDEVRGQVTKAAETARVETSTRTSKAVSSGLSSLLNKLPAVSITYKAPADGPAVPGDAVIETPAVE